MISDAAISAANLDVEKAEQELKSLSEALDRMKVRPFIRQPLEQETKFLPL